jgi:4-amino-4-deoxy-L-arabinose transferase-like glycosyltransferase
MGIINQNDLLQQEPASRALRGSAFASVRVSNAASLAVILVVYLALASLFAVKTPPWQAPDEPAHYNYVAYVAENGSFPVLHFGDYPHGYLEEVKTAKFPPHMPVTPIRYESHQPPLYYVIASPVYSLTGGSLIAIRLLSVLLGAGIVVFAWAIARLAVPQQPAIALGAAAVVAFLPQHLATVSQVGNDVVAELLLAAVLFVLLRGFGESRRDGSDRTVRSRLLLGVLLGLVLIAKTTAYIVIPVAAIALVWQWAREKAPARRVLAEGLAVLLPAALLALPWYARNIYVYDWPDFLGLTRHEQIVVGQKRTAEFIGESGPGAYWRRTFEWTFKSFAGVFGWMSAWLDTRAYYLMGLWMSIPLVGWLASGLGRANAVESESMPQPARAARVLLAVTAVFTLVAYIYYNITFLQHQGRYLFPALIPIAIFLAAGWRRALEPFPARFVAGVLLLIAVTLAIWGSTGGTGLPNWPLALTMIAAAALLATSFLPLRWRQAVYVLPFALLPAVAVYALFGVIVPALGLP